MILGTPQLRGVLSFRKKSAKSAITQTHRVTERATNPNPSYLSRVCPSWKNNFREKTHELINRHTHGVGMENGRGVEIKRGSSGVEKGQHLG